MNDFIDRREDFEGRQEMFRNLFGAYERGIVAIGRQDKYGYSKAVTEEKELATALTENLSASASTMDHRAFERWVESAVNRWDYPNYYGPKPPESVLADTEFGVTRGHDSRYLTDGFRKVVSCRLRIAAASACAESRGNRYGSPSTAPGRTAHEQKYPAADRGVKYRVAWDTSLASLGLAAHLTSARDWGTVSRSAAELARSRDAEVAAWSKAMARAEVRDGFKQFAGASQATDKALKVGMDLLFLQAASDANYGQVIAELEAAGPDATGRALEIVGMCELLGALIGENVRGSMTQRINVVAKASDKIVALETELAVVGDAPLTLAAAIPSTPSRGYDLR